MSYTRPPAPGWVPFSSARVTSPPGSEAGASARSLRSHSASSRAKPGRRSASSTEGGLDVWHRTRMAPLADAATFSAALMVPDGITEVPFAGSAFPVMPFAVTPYRTNSFPVRVGREGEGPGRV